MFKPFKTSLLVAAFVLTLALPVWANDKEDNKNEEKIKLEDCPAAVQQTIKDNAAGGQIAYVEKQTKGDKVVYEADVNQPGGKKIEVKVDANGKLLKVENEDEEGDKDADQGKGEDKD